MSKQAFELLDLESGYKYTLETSTDILPSDFNLVLPDRNGTLALTKDVDDLSGKIVRGDIVVGDSKKLDGKALSEIALSDMSNVTLTPEMVNSLRGFTGSAGSAGVAGPIGLQGGTGYTGSSGTNGSIGYTGSKGDDGVTGSAGPIGPQGYTGSKGTDGINGYTGSQGIQGYTGSAGVTGGIGYTGSIGATGPVGFTGSTGTNGSIGYTGSQGDVGVLETSYNLASSNVLNLNLGNLFTKTLTANTTFSVSNLKASPSTNSFIMELTNGGNFVITWWSGIKWSGGIAPVLTSNGVDILGFYSYDNGTTWRGMVLSKDTK